jgi:hypothetical protein
VDSWLLALVRDRAEDKLADAVVVHPSAADRVGAGER